MEYTLRSILDGVIITSLHPRTAINIIFQEVQNDSNVKLDFFINKLCKLNNFPKYLSCALNCACLALLDANIPLKYTFASVSCAILENENRIVYFPNLKQEKVLIK